MAFDKKPSTWLGPGYSSDDSAHTITMNTSDAPSDKTLLQLTDADADPDSGDIRVLLFALLEAAYQASVAQGPSNNPKKTVISRSASAGPGGSVIYNYSLRCTLTPTGNYVVPSE
jgi:hypothetical protein